jgi:ferredoxin--NADP+ reductase
VLLKDPASLTATDIADHALNALSDSEIREVVIVARRAFRDAAFSVGEFLALGHLDGVDVVLGGADLSPNPMDGLEGKLKVQIAGEYAQRRPEPGNKRLVFRFGVTPTEVLGAQRVEGLRVVPTGASEGDEVRHVIGVDRHRLSRGSSRQRCVRRGDGRGGQRCRTRCRSRRQLVAGIYVTGWVKRGARGVIGTNRSCAAETVGHLLADYENGKLARDLTAPHGPNSVLAQRDTTPLTWKHWQAIDIEERRRGAQAARPRVKFVDVAEMLAAAR